MIDKKSKYNPNNIKKYLLRTFIFSSIIFSSSLAYSQANPYDLKAVFIEKFSRFVTWPENSLMNETNEPFVVSVIGETRLTESLEQIYVAQKINNKRVNIKRISSIGEIENTHVLIIAPSERKNLQKILEITKNLPILTIGEAPNFAEKGVLINFIEENNKLRFEINEMAVTQSPLQMSFYLLNSAKIVNPVKYN